MHLSIKLRNTETLIFKENISHKPNISPTANKPFDIAFRVFWTFEGPVGHSGPVHMNPGQ